MSVLTIPVTDETWVNGATNRRGTNYVDAPFVQLLAGATGRRALLSCSLAAVRGRVVLDAYLVARAGTVTTSSVTLAAVTGRWQPSRVTWDTQPGVTTANQVVRAVPATSQSETVTFPGLGPMVQAVADGALWRGLQLSTTSTTTQSYAAADSTGPAFQLVVTLSDVVEAPDELRPDGGATATNQPVLSWAYPDQVSRRIQISSPAPGVAPDWTSAGVFDTGTQATTEQTFSLAAAGHTLTGGGDHYWRVQAATATQAGLPIWSDPARVTVTAAPGLVVDSPTGVFGDPTPTVRAHLGSGDLDWWKVTVTGPDRADVRATSGLSSGPLVWGVPDRVAGRRVLIEDEGGWINIQAADTIDRAPSIGDSGYVEVWIPAQLGADPALLIPTSLMVTQIAEHDPRHLWRWGRTEDADGWLMCVDGVTVARLGPEDVESPASGVYSWTDQGQIPPMRPRVLSVKALEDGAASAARSTDRQSHLVSDLWLVPDAGRAVRIWGVEVGGFTHVGRRATYEPLVGAPLDVIYDANPGRGGSFAGTIGALDQSEDDLWAELDAIDAIRNDPRGLVQLVWGSKSIRARIFDLDWRPSSDLIPGSLIHDVSFTMVEQDRN